MLRADFRGEISKLSGITKKITDEFVARKAELVQKHQAEISELKEANSREIKELTTKIQQFLQFSRSKESRHFSVLKMIFEHKIENAFEEAVKSVCAQRSADLQTIRDNGFNESILRELAKMANAQIQK